MRLSNRKIPAILVALILIPLCGCRQKTANGERPAVLHYAYAPSSEQMQGGLTRIDLLRNYLQSQLHMPVEVVQVQGYGPMVEAMRAEKIDVATLGPLSYLMAAQKAGAEAIVARGNADGTISGYRSVIAVAKQSPYHSMEDLKAHAKDLTFSFSDPASTSGDLYPRVGLMSAGINPDKDFHKIAYSGTHIATIMTVQSGKVDAGAFSEMALNNLINQKKIAPDDVRVIWTSSVIPASPTAVRKALPESLKKQIQDAFVNLPKRDPELFAMILAASGSRTAGLTNIAVDDHTYDDLRKYATQVKDFNFLGK